VIVYDSNWLLYLWYTYITINLLPMFCFGVTDLRGLIS